MMLNERHFYNNLLKMNSKLLDIREQQLQLTHQLWKKHIRNQTLKTFNNSKYKFNLNSFLNIKHIQTNATKIIFLEAGDFLSR